MIVSRIVVMRLGPCVSPVTLCSCVAAGGEFVSPGGGGGGSAMPTVGMLPAKLEVDSAHINATAIANFFIGFSSFEVEKDAEIST